MLRRAAFPLVFAAVAACSPSPSDNGDAGVADATDDGIISCQNDSRAMTYAPGVVAVGKMGVLKGSLAVADPAPPLRGTNTWSVKLTDAAGNAVTSPTVKVTPFMPDHGHGTSIVATATVQPDGTVALTPLYFFMPGLWRVTLDVTSSAGSDSIEFYFCVAG